MNPLWSYALAAVGILGIFLAGQKRSIGWAIGLGAQVLWIAYAIVTNQPGFIVSALAYAAVYGRNWWKWSHLGTDTGGTSQRRGPRGDPWRRR